MLLSCTLTASTTQGKQLVTINKMKHTNPIRRPLATPNICASRSRRLRERFSIFVRRLSISAITIPKTFLL